MRKAFFIIYSVSFVGNCSRHLLYNFITQSGLVLLVSFNQLPTESLTYLEWSDLSCSNNVITFSGDSFSLSIFLVHTPIGLVASTANRLIFSSLLDVHLDKTSIAISKLSIIVSLEANIATSITPK